MIRVYRAMLAGLVALCLSPVAAPAQTGAFSPVVIVNERPITRYELEQRIKILELFRTTGDVEKRAMEDLIDDRLRMEAASRTGISLTPEMTQAGMAEFAQRTNMDVPTFIQALAAQGVSEETFRDFINAGMAWREVVAARFGPRVEITDAEVDRALSVTSRTGGAEAQLAEIILPARDPDEAARSEALANQLAESVTTVGAFAAAAREYSLSSTRGNGGRLPRALPLSELPPPIRAQILTLAPGRVTDPISVPNAVAIFQLIELRETGLEEPQNVTLEYATYLIPGGRSEAALTEAASVIGRVDTCKDLYGVNKGQAPERLTVNSLPSSEVPRDVALELAKLDPGEISTALTRGSNLALLMLCARTPVYEAEPDRAAIRARLRNQRLGAYGEGYLAELRADAIILYP
ncbi:peptidylprolyl isomerase [Tropicimonas isoalkanivorans]|uniref:Parvulin-like PPIase n=1 Tax=Tropicimonas isoalkanivorans TaxID=441112 RepID=A0A1I1DV90_9RHOB|nr:peptidylprolyl isomerase [Tropicimonas isoalkanivorans]SFB78791.1 periplasmic chaperone for outer membrane proteins SurA [Tropicimonas isoalkanivorans]